MPRKNYEYIAVGLINIKKQTKNKEKTLKHELIVGLEYFFNEMYAERIKDTIKDNATICLFIQDEIKFKNNISLVLGGRFDYNNEYGNAISPKTSLMYKHKKFIYRGTFARGFRSPSIKEKYYDFDINIIRVFGNEDLIPEISTYYSISTEYLTNNHNFSLNLYNNNLTNMIHNIQLDDVFNGYTYENIANVKIYGIDLLARTKLISNLSAFSGYSYVYAYDIEKEKLLDGVSKHTITLTLDYIMVWNKLISNFTFSTRFTGEKTFVNIDDTSWEFFNDIYSPYSISKISSIHKFYNGGLNIGLGIDNLFNYQSYSDIVCIDPGRRFFVSLGISFEKLYNQIKIKRL